MVDFGGPQSSNTRAKSNSRREVEKQNYEPTRQVGLNLYLSINDGELSLGQRGNTNNQASFAAVQPAIVESTSNAPRGDVSTSTPSDYATSATSNLRAIGNAFGISKLEEAVAASLKDVAPAPEVAPAAVPPDILQSGCITGWPLSARTSFDDSSAMIPIIFLTCNSKLKDFFLGPFHNPHLFLARRQSSRGRHLPIDLLMLNSSLTNDYRYIFVFGLLTVSRLSLLALWLARVGPLLTANNYIRCPQRLLTIPFHF
jgi:hypothetical protein